VTANNVVLSQSKKKYPELLTVTAAKSELAVLR
jgi:hypothetical protein